MTKTNGAQNNVNGAQIARFEHHLFIQILFITVIIAGCSVDNTTHEVKDKIPFDTLNIHFPYAGRVIPGETALYIGDTIELMITSDMDQQYIHLVSFPDNSINRIDIYKAINRTAKEMSSVLVNGVLFHNPDSIFILLNPTNEIFLIDYLGNLVNNWQVSAERNRGEDKYLYSFFNIAPVVFIDNQLIVCQQSFDTGYETIKSVRSKKFKSPTDVSIELLDGKYEIFYQTGYFPSQYIEHYWFDVNMSRTINNAGQLVYSYGVSDSVFIYDKEELIKAISAKSQFVAGFKPFDGRMETNAHYVEQYTVEEPRYFQILYDQYFDCYYRIVLHSTELNNGDGTINTFADKPWSIIVLNNKFERQGEYIMKERLFDFTCIIPSPKGLLVSINHDLNPAKDPNKLKYVIFNFQDEAL